MKIHFRSKLSAILIILAFTKTQNIKEKQIVHEIESTNRSRNCHEVLLILFKYLFI